MGVIIVTGGVKGGIGKSTISSNLAVLAARDGLKVLLVDADSSDQQTTLRWAAERNSNPAATASVTTIALHGRSIRAELLRLVRDYDLVIVDPGARDSDTQRMALAAADLALIPYPPRGPDVWTIDAVTAMLAHVREVNPGLRAFVFINKADSRGENNAEAEAALADHSDSVESLPVRVGNRIALPNAHVLGLSAVELPRPDPKAQGELEGLYRAVITILEKEVEEE